MAHKVGKLISLKYSDRPTAIYGFVIDSGEDWTLLKYNPVDYIMDGYIIVRHKNLAGFRRDLEERFREKVIKLKRQHKSNLGNFPLTNLEEILFHLTRTYGIFQLELKSEKTCYLGRFKSIKRNILTIQFLDVDGVWREEMKFRGGDIRTISFDTDYINSLKLVSKRK